MIANAPSRTVAALAGIALLAVVASINASAQSQGGHAGHAVQQPSAPGVVTAATKAFEAVNAKMHADMAIKFTGDADVDFVRGMIPHHQGAIEMAEVILKHGNNRKVRQLATTIIREQKKEIKWMTVWLAKNAK